jgi:NitT/TauT family transport system substrate-binding protein
MIPAALLSLALQNACTCQPPQRLRLGMMPSAACAPLLLAAQQNIFQGQGLEVEFKTFAIQADALHAWSAQNFDVLCLNLAELVVMPQNYGIVLVPAYSNGADVLIARKDAGTNLNDLKGARIGMPPVSMGDLLLTRALNQHTLAREDFTVLPEEPQNLQESLEKSEIQLAVTAPPYSLDILKNPEMQIIFRSSAMRGEIIDTIAMRTDLLQTSPQLIAKMENVWQETLRYMTNEPQAALDFLALKSALPQATFAQDYKFLTLDEQRHYLKPEGLLLPMIGQLQDSLVQSGSLKTRRDTTAFLAIPTSR